MSEKSEANARLRAAQKALNANTAREKAAGIHEETPEYLELNQAVNDAIPGTSWWKR